MSSLRRRRSLDKGGCRAQKKSPTKMKTGAAKVASQCSLDIGGGYIQGLPGSPWVQPATWRKPTNNAQVFFPERIVAVAVAAAAAAVIVSTGHSLRKPRNETGNPNTAFQSQGAAGPGQQDRTPGLLARLDRPAVRPEAAVRHVLVQQVVGPQVELHLHLEERRGQGGTDGSAERSEGIRFLLWGSTPSSPRSETRPSPKECAIDKGGGGCQRRTVFWRGGSKPHFQVATGVKWLIRRWNFVPPSENASKHTTVTEARHSSLTFWLLF